MVDAVAIGLGPTLATGIFAALATAAAAAGAGLLLGLAVVAVVAYCNATSSARLAVRYPASGGTYVYGRERLGPFWGFLAGWGFVVGRTAACAATALTLGLYAWPQQAHVVGAAAAAALTAVNCVGVRRSARLTRAIVGAVLVVLAAVVMVCLTSPSVVVGRLSIGADVTVAGVLQAAALLFFSFAGYGRIAILGEEVRDPARTIPRAILLAMTVMSAVYVIVAVAVLAVLGDNAGGAAVLLADAVRAAGWDWLAPVVRVGAAVAALGSLLALMLAVSRTMLAMARDRYLPPALAAVHPRFKVPHRAELALGAVVVAVAGFADVRAVIGFSSFTVAVYYAIANASAWTLRRAEGRPPRAVPAVGLAGSLVVAFALPLSSVGAGVAVLALGAGGYGVRRALIRRESVRAEVAEDLAGRRGSTGRAPQAAHD